MNFTDAVAIINDRL